MMNFSSVQEYLKGVRLTLMLGEKRVKPAPGEVAEALISVEVTQNDRGRDGFQIVFAVGRGKNAAQDYSLMESPLLKVFNRVVLQVWLGAVPQVVFDGFITRRDLLPSPDPGQSKLNITGEDLRVMMDRKDQATTYPNMDDAAQVRQILQKYQDYFTQPAEVVAPSRIDHPNKTERRPMQNSNDLKYIEDLAHEHDFVFYVQPTSIPMTNKVYWGPENRTQSPLPPLSYNMGPQSNVNRLSLGYDSLRPTRVEGTIRDKHNGNVVQVQTSTTSQPALANDSATVQQGEYTRRIHMPDFGSLTPEQASARAQAFTDSAGDAVTVEGELDVMRYGGLMRPHSLVIVRGAGFHFDGRYSVQRVTHHIQRGSYTQDFRLTREGLGSTLRKVS